MLRLDFGLLSKVVKRAYLHDEIKRLATETMVHSDFLKFAGGIFIDSRYFAMVLRATIMPCLAKISVN